MIGDKNDRDWFAWHLPYDVPGSSLAVRLALVQGHISRALDEAPAGEVRVVSMCSGQGRDVIGASAITHGRATCGQGSSSSTRETQSSHERRPTRPICRT